MMKLERIIKEKVTMLHVTHKEALAIIKSLSNQLMTNCANGGRAEHSTATGERVSIAVDFPNELETK